jgi:hypothetical protein
MKQCTIQIRDEVNIKIEGLDLDARKALVNAFKYENPAARYLPAVRLGRWDGKVAYFQLGGQYLCESVARDHAHIGADSTMTLNWMISVTIQTHSTLSR